MSIKDEDLVFYSREFERMIAPFPGIDEIEPSTTLVLEFQCMVYKKRTKAKDLSRDPYPRN